MADMPSSPRRRRRRRLVWSLALFGGGLAGLGLLTRGLAATEIGRDLVEARLEALTPSVQRLAIEGLEGDLLGRFTIDQLTVADAEGIWLTADNVRLDWSPLALARRQLVIGEASLGTLRIARQPVLATSPATEDNGTGNLLRGGRLGTLTVVRLETGPDLTGAEAVFSISASGAIETAGWDIEADLVPEDAAGDRIDIDLTWPDGGVLGGRVEVAAPAGGLIASLARLADDQSMQVLAEASGDQDTWQLAADTTISGAPALSATVSREDGKLGGQASVDLSRHPLTAPIGARIGDALDATLSQVERDGRSRLSLQANTDRLKAAVSTDAGQADGSIAVVASLDGLGKVLGTEGVDAELVRIAFTTRNSPGDWSVDGDLSLGNLTTPLGPVRQVAGPVRFEAGAGPPHLRVALEASAADLDGPAGQLLGETPSMTLEARQAEGGAMLVLDRFQLSGTHAAVSASGSLRPADNLLRLSGALRADGRASSALPFDLAGTWETETQDGTRPLIRFKGEATDFEGLPAAFAPIVGSRVHMEVSARSEADGGVTLPALSIRAQGLDLAGQAARTGDGRLSARLEGDVRPDPGAVPGAPVHLEAALEGPIEQLAIGLSARTDQITLSGQELENAELTLDGTLAGSLDFTGQLSARADGRLASREEGDAGSEGGPLRLDTGLALNATHWRLDNLNAKALGVSASGEISAPFSDPLALTAALSVEGGPVVGTPVQSLNARARIDAAQLDLDARAEIASVAGLGESMVRFAMNGTPALARFEGRGESTLELDGRRHPVSLDLSGELAGLGDTVTHLVVSPVLQLDTLTTRVIEPVEVRRDAATGDLHASGRLGALGGTIEAEYAARAGSTHLRARHDGLALAPVLDLLQRPVTGGNLAGELTIATGTGPGDTEIRASGSLTGLAPPGDPDTPVTLDYTLTGDVAGLRGTLSLADNQGLGLQARLDAPLDPSPAWPGLALSNPEAARYDIAGDGAIDAVAALLLPPSVAMSGQLDLDLAGGLSDAAGTTTGRISFSGGRIEHGDLGLVLEDLAVVSTIDHGRFTLERFDATGPEGGTLSGQGAYVPGAGGSTLALKASNLFVVNRQDIRARGSGKLTLEETDAGLAIAGDITIDRAEIDPTQIQGASYQTLDVTFPNGSGDPEPAPEPPTDRTTRLALDIALDAPRRIFISGLGLDAEFGLGATITGPAGAPMITGEATIVRGHFDFAGKRFLFEESSVRLAGDPSEAELDLRAVREANDIRAVILITGTPATPEITLSSEPVLPEDEVLSRVLFGRSPSELSELEALQLAGGLASLAGSGGGMDLLGGLEDALGLDTLDLATEEGGGTSVATGKYLAEDVYLEVRTSRVGQPAVIIEWTPYRNLEVEADLTPGESQGARIEWQREFD